MTPNYEQRLRIKFTKVGPTRWIGNLDLQRAWERALNRAKMPMAYTQGFNQRPRMQLATALPLGFTSECELIDLWIANRIEPDVARAQLEPKMPPGLEIVDVRDVPIKSTALPAAIVEAHYTATLVHIRGITDEELKQRVDALMAAEKLIRPKRGKKNVGKTYDLRPLIYEVSVGEKAINFQTLNMRLDAHQETTGRPDEVLMAMDIDPHDVGVHRTAILLAES